MEKPDTCIMLRKVYVIKGNKNVLQVCWSHAENLTGEFSINISDVPHKVGGNSVTAPMYTHTISAVLRFHCCSIIACSFV